MQSSQTPLTAGDIVRLKSNGPLMTVGLINRDELKCFWVDQQESIHIFDMQGFLPNPLILERQELAPATAQPIQAGQRVRLHSSPTPIMTVNAVRRNNVYQYQEAECIWFTSAQTPLSKVIPIKASSQIE